MTGQGGKGMKNEVGKGPQRDQLGAGAHTATGALMAGWHS